MNSRQRILEAIKKGKPDFEELPGEIHFTSFYSNLTEQFTKVLEGIGGKVIKIDSLEQISAAIGAQQDIAKPTLNLIKGVEIGNIHADINLAPHEYEHLNLVLIEGEIAVAENAAIWVDEKNFRIRALPFITQHLVILINKDKIVANMHDAYKLLSFTSDYGTFIAGPSKTADIEQSLVIGAHGPRSLTVFII